MDTTVGVGLCFLMVTFFEKIFEARGIDVDFCLIYILRNLRPEIIMK